MAAAIEVVRTPGAMRELAEDRRRDGQRLCVVPTMGALHEGHLSLLRAGRARSDFLIATLFVNPTQFGPGEDLERYPRDEAGDVAKAAACGVDAIYAPTPERMYPPGYQSYVEVTELSQPLCGARRSGHFRGVATVVLKLFHVTCPHVAIFGQKDYQQLALLRRMAADLDLGVEILGMPIVREDDGLALSSRNAYLSPDERSQAVALHQGLLAAEQRFAAGERNAATLLAAARAPIEGAPLARIDYVELRDAASLAPVDGVEQPAVLAVAVFFGKTRLIDNVVLG